MSIALFSRENDEKKNTRLQTGLDGGRGEEEKFEISMDRSFHKSMALSTISNNIRCRRPPHPPYSPKNPSPSTDLSTPTFYDQQQCPRVETMIVNVSEDIPLAFLYGLIGIHNLTKWTTTWH